MSGAIVRGVGRKDQTDTTQREMDLARSVQDVTEEAMLRMARHVRQVTEQKNLCLAGGVALNCVGNGEILREGIFDRIWIQPAAGDAVGALGTALHLWHRYLDKPRHVDPLRDSQKASLLGSSFSDVEIKVFLDRNGYKYAQSRFTILAY